MWIHPVTKDKYQLDHFVMPCNQLKLTTNAKRKCDGAPSDHAAIFLQQDFQVQDTDQTKELEKKFDYNILRAGNASRFKEEVSNFITHLKKDFPEQPNDTLPKNIMNHFQNIWSTKDIAEHQVKIDPTGSHALKQNYYIISNSETKPSRIISTKEIEPP